MQYEIGTKRKRKTPKWNKFTVKIKSKQKLEMNAARVVITFLKFIQQFYVNRPEFIKFLHVVIVNK